MHLGREALLWATQIGLCIPEDLPSPVVLVGRKLEVFDLFYVAGGDGCGRWLDVPLALVEKTLLASTSSVKVVRKLPSAVNEANMAWSHCFGGRLVTSRSLHASIIVHTQISHLAASRTCRVFPLGGECREGRLSLRHEHQKHNTKKTTSRYWKRKRPEICQGTNLGQDLFPDIIQATIHALECFSVSVVFPFLLLNETLTRVELPIGKAGSKNLISRESKIEVDREVIGSSGSSLVIA